MKGVAAFGKFLKGGGILIAAVAIVPLLFIWSLNILLGLQLAYDFNTWFAAAIFIGIPLVGFVLLRRRI